MRLKVNKSKNSINYYIITDIKTKQGKRSTKVFKKLGNEQEILKISNGLLNAEYLSNIINVMKDYKNMVTLVIEDALKSQKDDLIRITEGLKQECLYIDGLLERVEKLANHTGNVSSEPLTNPTDDTPIAGRKIDI